MNIIKANNCGLPTLGWYQYDDHIEPTESKTICIHGFAKDRDEPLITVTYPTEKVTDFLVQGILKQCGNLGEVYLIPVAEGLTLTAIGKNTSEIGERLKDCETDVFDRYNVFTTTIEGVETIAEITPKPVSSLEA